MYHPTDSLVQGLFYMYQPTDSLVQGLFYMYQPTDSLVQGLCVHQVESTGQPAISPSSQCSTTGVTKAVVCIIPSVG